ncbi:MAG: DUF3887 domain-containing protein [Desulfitobacterium sp.]|nr:DUF3887 domain-containing protein [Desulfitobacterium sp.]
MKKRTQSSNLKKGILLAFTLMLSLLLLTACSSKLPEGFDQAEVEREAQSVITLLSERNTANNEIIREMGTENLKTSFTDDVFDEVYEIINKVGEFEKFTDTKVAGSSQNEQAYVIAVVKAKYDKKNLVYTISFDKNMKLAGVFIK